MQAETFGPAGTERGVRYLITSTGERIGWDICRNWDCMRSVAVCACPEGPRPPDYEPRLAGTDTSLDAVLSRVVAATSTAGHALALLPDAA
jgi:hypothetical protein